MATSGSVIQDFCYRNGGNRYYLQLYWQQVQQSTTGNWTEISATLYLGSYGSGYNMSASATKYGYMILDGGRYDFSVAGISLASGGKIALFSKRITMYHDSTGYRAFTVGGYFNPAVSISGSGSGSCTLPTQTHVLNSIARASSITSGASWTAGNNFTITCSLANSEYTNTINLYVNGAWIKRFEGVKTSVNTNFSQADIRNIFSAMTQNASVGTSISVTTYYNGSVLGTNTVYGTCTAPSASTTSSTKDWTIGNYHVLNINRANSGFTHTIQWKIGSTVVKTISNVGTQVEWTANSSEITTCEALIPNANTGAGTTTITTYYQDVQVRTPVTYNTTVYIKEEDRAPLINSTDFFAYDNNSSLVSIIGNNTTIVQNLSDVHVAIPANFATARRGASIYSYIVEYGDIRKEPIYEYLPNPTDTQYIYMGKVGVAYSRQLIITVKDTRGNTTSASKSVNIIPYEPITVNAFARRVNGFEENVILNPSGKISLLNINNNDLQSASTMSILWRKKMGSTGSYTSWSSTNFSISVDTSGNWSVTNSNGGGYIYDTLNAEDNAIYEFKVADRFTTTTSSIWVAQGIPTMFVDIEKNSVGINKLPTISNGLDINGGINLTGAITSASLTLGESKYWVNGDYGLNVGNSDIVCANGIWFNDICDAGGEGLLFRKSSTPYGSTNPSEFDTFYVYNGNVYLNGNAIVGSNAGVNSLGGDWGMFMNGSQSRSVASGDISKSIFECQNGWALLWSRYNNGYVMDDNFHLQLVHKTTFYKFSGSPTITTSWDITSDRSVQVTKKLYCNGYAITGLDTNSSGTNTYGCLRYIFEW